MRFKFSYFHTQQIEHNNISNTQSNDTVGKTQPIRKFPRNADGYVSFIQCKEACQVCCGMSELNSNTCSIDWESFDFSVQ